MGKRIHNAATSAWKRFMVLDHQMSRSAQAFTDTGQDGFRAAGAVPDYSAIKAQADSGARTAGF